MLFAQYSGNSLIYTSSRTGKATQNQKQTHTTKTEKQRKTQLSLQSHEAVGLSEAGSLPLPGSAASLRWPAQHRTKVRGVVRDKRCHSVLPLRAGAPSLCAIGALLVWLGSVFLFPSSSGYSEGLCRARRKLLKWVSLLKAHLSRHCKQWWCYQGKKKKIKSAHL